MSRVRNEVRFFVGALNWNGRAAYIWYRVRGLFVAPAPPEERCFMGSPVAAEVHCPRRAVPGGPWCERHMEEPS